MSDAVVDATLRVLLDRGIEVDHDALADRYVAAARDLVRSYAMDASFNAFEFDRSAELEQVDTYADAIGPPAADDRLPRWRDSPISVADLREAAAADLRAVTTAGCREGAEE
jgi:glucosyl-3-phosphoglycerate synthase